MDGLFESARLLCGVVLLVLSAPVLAENRTFLMVGKNLDDRNFVAAWQGCQDEAEKHGDRCVHVGPAEQAHMRLQDRALAERLDEKPDGIAISVTDSDLLAHNSIARAREQGIPVITFDSDFSPDHQALRAAYVGPDNFQLGRKLGRIVKDFRPGGGSLCIISNSVDTNLKQRLRGVRSKLGSDDQGSARLDGSGEWSEPDRCPWHNDDNPKRSLAQLGASLGDMQVDAVVSTGHWPIVNPAAYRRAVAPFSASLKQGTQLVVLPTGAIREQDLALLDEGRLHGLVAIDFDEIGRVSYRKLRRLSEGLPVESRSETSLTRILHQTTP